MVRWHMQGEGWAEAVFGGLRLQVFATVIRRNDEYESVYAAVVQAATGRILFYKPCATLADAQATAVAALDELGEGAW